MRRHGWLVGLLALAVLVAAGCWYQAPNTKRMFNSASTAKNKDEVIKAIGRPTAILENEMFYIYDDPENPVRFRFVLDDKGRIVEKFYETKADLAKKAEETMGKVPPIQPLPGEEKRTYPGGPIERFQEKPGEVK